MKHLTKRIREIFSKSSADDKVCEIVIYAKGVALPYDESTICDVDYVAL